MNSADFANRLKEVRETLGLTQQELANSIDEKQTKIKDIETSKQKISPELAYKVEKIHQINFKWLLTGEGEMFAAKKDEDKIKVPVDYEQSGSCGRGCFIQDNKCPDFINLSKFWIRNVLGASFQDLIIIFASGDSMDDTIQDGDMLLVDKTQTEPQNGVYLVRFYNELFVKRVQIHPDKIILKSDNAHYDPIDIKECDFDGIQIIGKVVWNGSKKNI